MKWKSISLSDQRAIFDNLGSKLGIKEWEDWYKITEEDIIAHGGSGLLNTFNQNHIIAIMTYFPEHPWKPFKFMKVPNSIWRDMSNQRAFFEDLANRLNITGYEQFYNLKVDDIIAFGGRVLLDIYDSISDAFKSIYPEYPWKVWKFTSVPNGWWSVRSNQREYMDWLHKELQLSHWSDWYFVSRQDIAQNDGTSIMRYFSDVPELITTIYPEYPWNPSNFQKASSYGIWSTRANRKNAIEEIGKELGVKELEDWYNITNDMLRRKGAGSLLSVYEDSLERVLTSVYPEHRWESDRFNKVSEINRSILIDTTERKKFIEHLIKVLDIKSMEDWYRVTKEEILKEGGALILKYYSESLPKMITSFFPDYHFQMWRFQSVALSYSFWEDQTNQREFLDWIYSNFKLKSMEDWYSVSKLSIKDSGGQGLLSFYNNSIESMLNSVYPEYKWETNRFQQNRIEGYWFDKKNQREFLDRIGKIVGVKGWEDWYKVSSASISELGAASILNYYQSSFVYMILGVYPEYPWLIWKFEQVPQGFWSEQKNRRAFFDWLWKELGLVHWEDWYEVKAQDIAVSGGSTLIQNYYSSNVMKAVMDLYPEFSWDPNYRGNFIFSRGNPSKSQVHIFRVVKELFPLENDIHFNYLHPELKFISDKQMELDIYIPSVNIAIEYQGKQHFKANELYEGGVLDRIRRDTEKRESCKKAGITLIEIPYWWDGTAASLQSTIHQIRPELFPKALGVPIPTSYSKGKK